MHRNTSVLFFLKCPRDLEGTLEPENAFSNMAAYAGAVEVFMKLVSMKFSADSKNAWGRTQHSYAANYSHDTVVRLLLADDKVKPYSRMRKTVRRSAVSPATATRLLANDKAKPDSRHRYSWTPLSCREWPFMAILQ